VKRKFMQGDCSL